METRLLIAGERVAGEGPGLDVENPYTQTTLATVALPSSEQVDAAIAGASAAARGWANTPAVERCELLHEVAARLRASSDALADLMTREGGKPLIENADEIGWTAAAFERRSSTPGRSAPRPSAST
jgi:acyl-CoA reductase-like NAD-dependent aldehyde dehydrogenase